MIFKDIADDLRFLSHSPRTAGFFRRHKFFQGLYTVWMTIALTIGWFVFRILLIAVYLICIIPLGIVFRLLKKDVLNRSAEPGKKTYWINVETDKNRGQYLKKF